MSDKDKGFASMDKDKVKEIASKGGQASHGNKDNHDHKNKNSDDDSDNKKNDSDKSKSHNNK